MKRILSRAASLMVLSCAAAGAAYGTAAPVVTVAASSVTASGVSPGTQVVFFGVGLEPKGYHVDVHRWSVVVTDTAHSGTVTLALDKPVTYNVVWVVADLRNGHYAIASTHGFPTTVPDKARFRLRRDTAGSANRLAYARPFIDGLYLEAGGAWIVSASDGDDSDADGKPNGETTMDLLRATSVLAGTDSPRKFTPNGTLFVIDVSRLDVLTVTLDESLIAGAR